MKIKSIILILTTTACFVVPLSVLAAEYVGLDPYYVPEGSPATATIQRQVNKSLYVTYQNKTAKTIYVSVVTHNANAGTTTFRCEKTPQPATIVSSTSGGNQWDRTNFFIVPPGYYYMGTTDSGGYVVSWVEWY
ncbi:exported hypothetical protein [Gammaproteobacteria bacterium]